MWAGVSDGIGPKQRLSNTNKPFLAQESVEMENCGGLEII